MKRTHYLVVLLALLGADAPAQPALGTVEGSVVAVKNGKPIARDDVYVYLQPIPKPRRGAPPGAGKRVEIRQKGQEFVPRIVVVPVGAEVAFPNFDPDTHNVFSPTDPVFDLGRYATDKKGKSHRFDEANEFDIFCDMHRHMWAKVKVVDSAFITPVVGGNFKLTNVPAGKYKVVAWVRNSPEVRSAEIVVTAGGTTKLDRALHLQVKTRSGCHDRKDGTAYPSKDYNRCPDDY